LIQIQDQPKSADFITLQFDRKSVLVTDIPTDVDTTSMMANELPTIQKVDQGVWSVKGRRPVQEDAFILHEVLDTKDRSVILAGVFDGHLGSAASDFCRNDLPVAFAAAMNVGTSDDKDNNSADDESNASFTPSTIQSYLELAWNECCESYRSMCDITDAECIAEYDPKEGILQAKTGSQTAVAGTTAMVFAFDQSSNQLATLNCGDSRGIVLNDKNELIFQTTDHSPDVELERLTEMGMPPKCDIARWTIAVNNYEFSVARSLEGYLATSKGIISDADITLLTAQPGMTIIAATDGLWDTIDTAEVMKVIAELRQIKSNASDIAKALCSLAYKKGSLDNISVVALCLE
jgi:serine/threonine protein phosphatase PrpC